jgi:hypothetical protein
MSALMGRRACVLVVIVGAVAMGAVVLGTASVGAAVVTTPIVVAVMGADAGGEMVEAPEPGLCGTDDCSQDRADRAAAPATQAARNVPDD